MENINTIRKILYTIIGVIGTFLQFFSLYIIGLMLMYITEMYLEIGIVLIILTSIEIERYFYMKKRGLKPQISMYKEE